MIARSAVALRLLAMVAIVAAAACRPSDARDASAMRLRTEDFYIRVTSDPSPPRALEQIEYTIVVLDKETRQPIETGEGRIFGNNEDGKGTNNGFTKAAEPGTYRTKLFFATAGPWALGIQFRRDSTQRLQRTTDWIQEVFPETPPGPPPAGQSGQ